LLGVSGISSDMRTLLASHEPRAKLAVDLFVYRIGRELGSLAAALGGLDALVFTGGIGERSAAIRERVCRDAHWLGIEPDPAANLAGGPRVSAAASRVHRDAGGNLRDIEDALLPLLREQRLELLPETLRARRRSLQELAVALIGRVIALDEVAQVDAMLPGARPTSPRRSAA